MTTTPASAQAGQLEPWAVADVVSLLTTDFGRRDETEGVLANQVLLDALDRGERDRFVVWPAREPTAVLYVSPTETLVAAGDRRAGPALAIAAEKTGWRVLMGDALLGGALLEAYPRGVFRRRPSARQQRFMAVTGRLPDVTQPGGFRRATSRDLERLTEFACTPKTAWARPSRVPPGPVSGRA